MLVLTRRRNQDIYIDGPAIVKVIEVGRTTVKLGIEAAPSTNAVRGEILAAGDVGELRREILQTPRALDPAA